MVWRSQINSVDLMSMLKRAAQQNPSNKAAAVLQQTNLYSLERNIVLCCKECASVIIPSKVVHTSLETGSRMELSIATPTP